MNVDVISMALVEPRSDPTAGLPLLGPNRTDGSDSHFCVMISASVALSQSQHIGVSHYHLVWLCPSMRITQVEYCSFRKSKTRHKRGIPNRNHMFRGSR
jgi:hypothetical protein